MMLQWRGRTNRAEQAGGEECDEHVPLAISPAILPPGGKDASKPSSPNTASWKGLVPSDCGSALRQSENTASRLLNV